MIAVRPPSLALSLAAALACATAAPARAESASAPTAGASLYSRLGGYDFLARFVDTAFPRVAAHPKLHRLFQGHSRDSQIRQRQLIIDALCRGTGGPCAYTGRDLKAVHVGLQITDADWSAFVGVLGGALNELGAPAPERKEFLHLLERRFRPDVVESR